MEGKGVKTVVEALIVAMLMLLFADQIRSTVAATTVDYGINPQCIRECLQACPRNENCLLTCPVRCTVHQTPTPLPYDNNLHAYCKRACSFIPRCIRFNHDENRMRRCIAECGTTCLANKGSDF